MGCLMVHLQVVSPRETECRKITETTVESTAIRLHRVQIIARSTHVARRRRLCCDSRRHWTQNQWDDRRRRDRGPGRRPSLYNKHRHISIVISQKEHCPLHLLCPFDQCEVSLNCKEGA